MSDTRNINRFYRWVESMDGNSARFRETKRIMELWSEKYPNASEDEYDSQFHYTYKNLDEEECEKHEMIRNVKAVRNHVGTRIQNRKPQKSYRKRVQKGAFGKPKHKRKK